jgi:hypothetical protein
MLRLWETAGNNHPVKVQVNGYNKVILCNLIEEDIGELEIKDHAVEVDIRPFGFAALRLIK